MAVKKNFSGYSRRRISGSVFLQKFAQQERLLPQSARARIVRKEIDQLVSKNRRAAGLEHNDRQPSVNLGAQCIHEFVQILLGVTHHSKAIQTPTPTQTTFQPFHTKPTSS